jgi:DNA-binding response OmpR family regulator
MTKPLVASELAARIKALLRRRRPADTLVAESRRRVGDLEIWLTEGLVRRGESEIRLTRTEFRLLAELVQGDGRALSRETLLQRVWGYDYCGDTRLLDVHVRRLRRKIEPDPDAPSVLITVR